MQDMTRKVPMSEVDDCRVDACIWLIQPHVFSPLEAQELVLLSTSAVVIPVMAKVLFPHPSRQV
jgi:septin family protein